ncbi:AAA family ATPase [uncultured virus]|nr:AAA family ATPase [uncultured virus]
MLPIPSDEQQEVITYFKMGYNEKIQAIAGAGKTTTLLLLASEAKNNFGARTLILTYNRDLKDEIADKIQTLNLGFALPQHHQQHYERDESECELKITEISERKISDAHGKENKGPAPIKLIGTGCDVYTYHGFASRLFGQNIYNDAKLRDVLNEPTEPVPYDILLLDEVQDMNVDYYQLVTKMLAHGKMLVLVGDYRQCINEYIGATSEYLINYDKYFDTGRPWKELMLRRSYRLTPSIAKFVNNHILGENLIIAGNKTNKDCKPIYNYGVWDLERLVISSVKTYGTNDVVIMLPSVRNINPKSPIGRLCAKRQSGILFCIKDGEVSSEIMKNKVLITSYNSMKGRERKCVIVVGFDESYFEYYDRKWDNQNKSLPNIIYVAATRARESLILVQDERKLPFRTVNVNRLNESCEVYGGLYSEDQEKEKGKGNNKEKNYLVPDLIRHRNTTDTCDLLKLLTIKTIKSGTEPLPCENIVQFNEYYEDTCSYYSILIPLLVQYKRIGSTDLPLTISKKQYEASEDLVTRYNNLMNLEIKSIKEWMELVVIYTSLMNKSPFYAYQITHYNWVNEDFINKQIEAILTALLKSIDENKLIDENKQDDGFKRTLKVKDSEIIKGVIPEFRYSLEGSVDYFNQQELWDFKCSSSLADEHKIQCGAYAAMYNIQTRKSVPCKLFNTRTGEILEITVTDPNRYLNVLTRNKRPINKDTL